MSHTKTAISIPDELFQRLEDEARAAGASRSAVVTRALEQYLGDVEASEFIRRMNAALGPDPGEEANESARARRTAQRMITRDLAADEEEPWQR
ncbi:MAG TPA: ribbon-helix-helix protein, CopG family [Tepidiformaceae bacterium]|nr:ribbon-helix-helix protein, CopG family [Tepidiformaceae bacterium]